LNQVEVFKALDQNLVLLTEARSRIWLTLRRSPRFLPLMEKALAQAGVPVDLKYLPLSVTHLSPAYNNIGRGLWRLREAEARALGLRLDAAVDERLDPTAATVAAAKRLTELKKTYGSWTSAMAAHLLGEPAFQRAVDDAGGETNFYKLYFQDGQDQLPMTVLAGKILFQDPAAFGYVQEPARAWPAWPGKRTVTPAPTTIKALADQYGRDYKSFRDMNPHLLGSNVPAGANINY
jgi:membrane-bound lytic murein transglycosylase D